MYMHMYTLLSTHQYIFFSIAIVEDIDICIMGNELGVGLHTYCTLICAAVNVYIDIEKCTLSKKAYLRTKWYAWRQGGI